MFPNLNVLRKYWRMVSYDSAHDLLAVTMAHASA